MTETKNTNTVEAYLRYHKSAASRLRYAQAQENMETLHNLDHFVHILDAASGDGMNAEYFLSRGHRVTLVDSNPEMLKQAHLRIEGKNFSNRCRFVEGTLETIDKILKNEQFDLILCHHVLEYTVSSPEILKKLRNLVSSEGELSLIILNPVSEVIRAVFFRKDPALAEKKLTNLDYDAKWFGQAKLYTFDQIKAWAENAGWELKNYMSIRVLADYISEKELDDTKEKELLRLEKKLADLDPYRQFGRYLQFCFQAK